MQHHVALPPDAMGKISYIAPPGQYSLQVCLCAYLSILICLPEMFNYCLASALRYDMLLECEDCMNIFCGARIFH